MGESAPFQARFAYALNTRPFALVWTGQTISAIGDGAFLTALAWQVLLLTGSGTAMGVIMVVRTLPMVLLLPFGGVVADRVPRYLVMLWSDAGRAIVVLLLAALGWLHLLQFWHLAILSLSFGVVDAFFLPAYQAIPPQLVETEALPSANALTGISQQTSQLLGPLLGAGCVALLGPASAFAFDGVTFVASALCLTALRLPNVPLSPSPHDRQGLLADMRDGLSYISGSTWLWVSILIASLANMGAIAAIIVALPKLVHDVYGSGVWLLGTLTALFAVGTMIGAFFVGQKRHLRRRGIFAYSGMIIFSVSLVAFGLPLPSIYEVVVACVASLVLGLGLGIYQVIWVTIMQELVPTDKLGRVSSIDTLVSTSLLPLGFALVGVLTDHIGPSRVFIAAGVLCVALASIALSIREIRRLE